MTLNSFRFETLAILIGILILSACQQAENQPESQTFELPSDDDLAVHVNPFIGTGGHGHTFPGATLPFGMVQLSPDTRLEGWDGCSGYHYTDSIVYGYSHTHLSGTGVADYCDILFKPGLGEVFLNNGMKTGPEQGYASYFEKSTEEAAPGYYRLKQSEGIDVELTATARTGLHRYTFEKNDRPHVVLDLLHRDEVLSTGLEIINDSTVQGYRVSKSWATEQHVYFYAVFSKPFSAHQEQSHTKEGQPDAAELLSKAHFEFDLAAGDQLLLKVGISAVDQAGAKKNLEAELPGWDFEEVRKNAREAWNQELRKVQVGGGSADDQSIFYTALYHSMIAPNLFSDVDGRYRKALPKNIEIKDLPNPIGQLTQGEAVYTIFSLWDTYRATHPLYTLIDQKRTGQYINTFLHQYQDGGQLPVWELAGNFTGCMIGYHSVSVIADAYAKGIQNFDTKLALEAMQHSAEQDHLGLLPYREKGYIPTTAEPESVSKTLEYAYDDWCIGDFAQRIGQPEVATLYLARAQSYKNLYNGKNLFLMGRQNGGWFGPFLPDEVNFNYTEANGWQYSLAVPQDVSGLIKLMGGEKALSKHLDNMFTAESATSGRHQVDITGLIGQYAHGNEPSHHMAYLYNYTGEPWKTQAMVTRIMREMYQNAPDGLSGNEDCGQMSSWYVLSALGFYPVCPGRPEYAIGRPQFPVMEMTLENGKTFRVEAQNWEDGHSYIQSVRLNDQDHPKSFLTHNEVMQGGVLVVELGPEPNKQWATAPENRPQSKIEGEGIAVVPSIEAPSQTFEAQLEVELKSPQANASIHYTLDGSAPTKDSPRYADAIVLEQDAVIKAIGLLPDGRTSQVAHSLFRKIKGGRTIQLATAYANQYSAGGDKALIDYLQGGKEFRTGNWQGYEKVNLEATVDLGSKQAVNRLSLGCLQDVKSWIWFPKAVSFYLSNDGKNYRKVGAVQTDFSEKEYGSYLKNYVYQLSNEEARYVKVVAENRSTCPPWHPGAGDPCWLFVDEFTID
ncbi:MAG: GH92 family glycosyl hydrolase [Salibacteraceae bacterium]